VNLRSPLHCVRQSALQAILDCLIAASEGTEDHAVALRELMQQRGGAIVEAMLYIMSLTREAGESYADRMTSVSSSEVNLAAQILQACCLYSTHHDLTPSRQTAVSKVRSINSSR
jgi:hypothetical protein